MTFLAVRRIALPGTLLCALLLQSAGMPLPEVICRDRGGARLESADLFGFCRCHSHPHPENPGRLAPLRPGRQASWRSPDAARHSCVDVLVCRGRHMGRSVRAEEILNGAPHPLPAAPPLLPFPAVAGKATGLDPPPPPGPGLSLLSRLRC